MNQEQLNAIETYAVEQREKGLPTSVFVEMGSDPDESRDMAQTVGELIAGEEAPVLEPEALSNLNTVPDWTTVLIEDVGIRGNLSEFRNNISYGKAKRINVVVLSPTLDDRVRELVDYAVIKDNGLGTFETYESLTDSLAGKTYLRKVTPEPSHSTQSE